jgi:hypothetical protein
LAGLIFFNQNNIVLVKEKKNQWICNRVLPGQLGRGVSPPGHIRFFLPLFFLQPGPVLAPGRQGPESTCQAEPGFKTMETIVFLTSVS